MQMLKSKAVVDIELFNGQGHMLCMFIRQPKKTKENKCFFISWLAEKYHEQIHHPNDRKDKESLLKMISSKDFLTQASIERITNTIFFLFVHTKNLLTKKNEALILIALLFLSVPSPLQVNLKRFLKCTNIKGCSFFT
jgi:hypothetical protein